jgi:hypothetical protein
LSAISMAVPAWISDIEASYKDDAYFTNLVQQLVVNANSVLDFAIYSSTIRYKGRIYIGQSTDLKLLKNLSLSVIYAKELRLSIVITLGCWCHCQFLTKLGHMSPWTS